MKEKTKKWIKIVTYFLPFIWLVARNYLPMMQFRNIKEQGTFLLFLIFTLCASMITFPKFEAVNSIFNGNPEDRIFTHAMKTMFVLFMIAYIAFMVYSCMIFKVLPFWENTASQIIFLFTLTWYSWFSFGMSFLKFVDMKEFEEATKLVEED